MSKPLFVTIIVEGPTEANFVKTVLAPSYYHKNIFFNPIILSKKGQKGGDVKFQRVENDIATFLRHSDVSVVTTLLDYYGLKEWPDKDKIKPGDTPQQIADCLNNAAKAIICENYDDLNPSNRYIPFMAIHEFETLLFSDADKLASHLNISPSEVNSVLDTFANPEYINNSPETAPSKRLENWSKRHYRKTTQGIVIARDIGIDTMREKCPLFDAWLQEIEGKQEEEQEEN